MTMPYDITRCTGSYTNLHGEFGAVIHQECIGCQRRKPGHPERQSYMVPPVFGKTCPNKIIGEER